MELEFRMIRVGELAAFVASDEFRRLEVLPISPIRGRSQAKNPRARPDDVALVLASFEGRLVGYLGALPDLFFEENGESRRVAWLSCLWVSPTVRGRGVAKKLLARMLEAWKNEIILSEFTKEVSGLYERSGAMKMMPTMVGLRGYLRPCFADILSQKGPYWLKMNAFLKSIDRLLALPNGLRLLFFRGSKTKIQLLERVDEAAEAFIGQHQKGENCRRDAASLNWMLENPWLAETDFEDEFLRKYHFSSTARAFYFQLFEVQNEAGNTAGIVLFQLRNGHLRIPFAWFSDAETARVGQAILAEAIRLNVKILTVFNPRLVAFLNENRTPFFWKRAQKRRFFVGNGLADFFENRPFLMQDGEGDLGFT